MSDNLNKQLDNYMGKLISLDKGRILLVATVSVTVKRT